MPPGQGALENSMSLWRRFLAFIASIYTHKPAEDDLVTDTTVETPTTAASGGGNAPVSAELSGGGAPTQPVEVPTVSVEAAQAAVAQAAATESAPVTAGAALDTDKLKAILAVLGHDLGAVWDDAVALAKKAI